MSGQERHLQCSTCGEIRPETEARNIPIFRPATESYVDGYHCDAHARDALTEVRRHIAALDLDNDERDETMPLMMLLALLRARGLQIESLAPGEAGGEGMERIRQQVLALLGRVERGFRLPIVEPAALCSACFRALPASQIRVIPWHNETLDNFVTTFRCGDCVATALAETRARLEAGGDREVVQLAEFFGRHAVLIHEHRRGDPPAAVRPLLAHLLGRLERGELTLAIGETVPLKEVLSKATPPPEAPPPPAPPPTAEPPSEPAPSLWRRIQQAFGRKPN
ncbi:hypothetical protein [Polyangium aurulentum]|uniref:hypothetical protein n=1 Tax=Polyangium aurulentum TaxID=2567896 RepID=UPI0010AE2818|nr:hypothetical protein [Polyangium aurulentum]UQA57486.1 hypothetical protein E8A73_040410 [Polyangium aurulentum]